MSSNSVSLNCVSPISVNLSSVNLSSVPLSSVPLSSVPRRIEVAGVAVDTRHYIGGARRASDATFSNSSPIDGSSLGEISRGVLSKV